VNPHLLSALEQLRQVDLNDMLVTITDDRIRMRKTHPS
jgi:hypothetical protein